MKNKIKEVSDKELCNDFVDRDLNLCNEDLCHDAGEYAALASLSKEMKKRGIEEGETYEFFDKNGELIIDRSGQWIFEENDNDEE